MTRANDLYVLTHRQKGISTDTETVFSLNLFQDKSGETTASFLGGEVKNTNTIYISSVITEPANSLQPFPNIELKTKIFGSGTFNEHGAKIKGDNNNSKAKLIKKATTGQAIDHDLGHYLLKLNSRWGHKDNSILDTEYESTKVTEDDTKKILEENKGKIKEQNKKS